jgi:hypothetical protein
MEQPLAEEGLLDADALEAPTPAPDDEAAAVERQALQQAAVAALARAAVAAGPK